MSLYIDYSKKLHKSRLGRQELAQQVIQRITSRVVPIKIPVEIRSKIVRDFILPRDVSKLSAISFYVSLQLTLLMTGTKTTLNYFFPRFILHVKSERTGVEVSEKEIVLDLMVFSDDLERLIYHPRVVFPQKNTQRLGNILFYVFSHFPMNDPQSILEYNMSQHRAISRRVLEDFVEERNFRLKLYSPESVAKISFLRYLDTHIREKWNRADQKRLTMTPLKFDLTLRRLSG